MSMFEGNAIFEMYIGRKEYVICEQEKEIISGMDFMSR